MLKPYFSYVYIYLFQITSAEMVLLRNQASDSYSTFLLSELGQQKLTEFDALITLVSGEDTVKLHRSILNKVSPFLHNIISSSCYCQSHVLILPVSPSSPLSSIASLIYTGTISGIDMNLSDHIRSLARLLGIEIKRETIRSK